jgi:hypothetical protein
MKHEQLSEGELATAALAGDDAARAALRSRMEELATQIIRLYKEEVPTDVAVQHFDQALVAYGKRLKNPGADKPYKFSTYFLYWMTQDIDRHLGTDDK